MNKFRQRIGAGADAISRAPAAKISSNTAMLPGDLSAVTRKRTLSYPSWMTSSAGILCTSLCDGFVWFSVTGNVVRCAAECSQRPAQH